MQLKHLVYISITRHSYLLSNTTQGLACCLGHDSIRLYLLWTKNSPCLNSVLSLLAWEKKVIVLS